MNCLDALMRMVVMMMKMNEMRRRIIVTTMMMMTINQSCKVETCTIKCFAPNMKNEHFQNICVEDYRDYDDDDDDKSEPLYDCERLNVIPSRQPKVSIKSFS